MGANNSVRKSLCRSRQKHLAPGIGKDALNALPIPQNDFQMSNFFKSIKVCTEEC